MLDEREVCNIGENGNETIEQPHAVLPQFQVFIHDHRGLEERIYGCAKCGQLLKRLRVKTLFKQYG